MISAPMPQPWRSAKASSTPAVPPASQNRVPNIHSCRRSPAWPNGASADCGSPVAKPSREMEKLWIRASDIVAPRLVVAPAIALEEDDRGGWGKSSATDSPGPAAGWAWTSPGLPMLRRQGSGQVITVTSTAGLIGQEFCAAYAASKFALEGWMDSLRFDVAPYGISTMAVEPGFFRTELLVEGSSTIWPELSIEDYADRTAQTIAAWKSVNGQQSGDPAKLAAALVTL